MTLSEHEAKILAEFDEQFIRVKNTSSDYHGKDTNHRYLLGGIDTIKAFLSQALHSTAELTKEAITPEKWAGEFDDEPDLTGHSFPEARSYNKSIETLESKWRQFNE